MKDLKLILLVAAITIIGTLAVLSILSVAIHYTRELLEVMV